MIISIQTLIEIIRLLLTTNKSNHHIARLTGVAPNTVRRYKKLVNRTTLDWHQVKQMTASEVDALFNKKKQPQRNKRQPDWQYVHKQMQAHKHQTLAQLWEEYRAIEPETAYSQSQFNFYYRDFLKKVDITMRQTHYAGECVYVDYAGKTISYVDSVTGEQKQAQVFVGVMGCSQYTFAFASKSQKLEDFIEAHNQLFTFLGGVPQVVVPDNLKSAVTKPGKFATINRTYLEQSRHYNCVIEPARVRKPQDKSLAEIGVLMVTRWITVVLRKRTFFSIEEINLAIRELLPKLNERPFKRIEGNRLSRFEVLDKPAIQPLPSSVFEFAKWISSQQVSSDYHVPVYKHYYSVPYQFVGQRVEARVTKSVVEFIHNNKRIASHPRKDDIGEYSTIPTHRPKSHRIYAEQSCEHYIEWANDIGDKALAIVKAQYEGKPNYAMVGNKACSQLQSLARMYGNDRFEAACQCAVEIQSFTVKSVRSILQCKIDQRSADIPKQNQLPLHHNIRGAEYYQLGGF